MHLNAFWHIKIHNQILVFLLSFDTSNYRPMCLKMLIPLFICVMTSQKLTDVSNFCFVRNLLSDNYFIRTIFQLWIDYYAKMWKFVFQPNSIHILIKQVISNISLFQQEIMFAHDCWSASDQIQCKQLLYKAKIRMLKCHWNSADY